MTKFQVGDLVKPTEWAESALRVYLSKNETKAYNGAEQEKEEIRTALGNGVLRVKEVMPAPKLLGYKGDDLYGFEGFEIFCLYESELELAEESNEIQ